MQYLWMLIFWVLPLAAMVYLAWHFWCLLPLGGWWKALIIAIGIGCFLLLFLNFARKFDMLPLWLASTCYNIGTSSLIVMLYMFMVFLLLDLGRLVRLVPRDWLYSNWITLGTLTALLVVIFVYGNLHYHHKYRQELTLTTDKPLQKELKLVMLSDMHIGYHNRRADLARWVDMLNEEHADMILIAGDIIDGSMCPLLEERMTEEFRRLNAPVYACLGNHEFYAGHADAVQFYKDAGIHLLRDEVVDTLGIRIIGREDRSQVGRKDIASLNPAEPTESEGKPPLSGRFGGAYTIVLDHQPYHLDRTAAAGIDFQFSGHTHHGQVWPISWITESIYECAYGEYQLDKTRFYVSSGLGIWGGKFRIGTRAEYVVATIKK